MDELLNLVRTLYILAINSANKEVSIPADIMKEILDALKERQ